MKRVYTTYYRHDSQVKNTQHGHRPHRYLKKFTFAVLNSTWMDIDLKQENISNKTKANKANFSFRPYN